MPRKIETVMTDVPGYIVPEEFLGEAPRPIPAKVRQGRKARRSRATVIALFVSGVICLLLSPWEWVQTLGLYVLPLAYLQWIGGGLLGLALAAFLWNKFDQRGYRYISEGVAAPAGVRSIVKAPKAYVNGQPSVFHLVAAVELVHPDTAKATICEIASQDISAGTKDATHAPFRVGDTVTAVWLPNEFEKTFNLYDFLELVPEHELRRDSASGGSLAAVLGLAIFLPLFFIALFWNVYALGRYWPVAEASFSRDWPVLAIGGLLLGVPVIVGLYWSQIRERNKIRERNREALEQGEALESEQVGDLVDGGWRTWLMGAVMVFGGILMGGLTMLSWFYTANALLDDSKGQMRPVQITEGIMTTHAFLFREYQLKYKFAGDDEEHSLLTTPRHITSFQLPIGFAEIHEGRFGRKWVKTVHPIDPRQLPRPLPRPAGQ